MVIVISKTVNGTHVRYRMQWERCRGNKSDIVYAE